MKMESAISRKTRKQGAFVHKFMSDTVIVSVLFMVKK